MNSMPSPVHRVHGISANDQPDIFKGNMDLNFIKQMHFCIFKLVHKYVANKSTLDKIVELHFQMLNYQTDFNVRINWPLFLSYSTKYIAK